MITEFSLAVANYLNPTDAIVYNYLQDQQRVVFNARFPDEHLNFREGRWWINQLGAGTIHEGLPCFKSKQTIHDSIERLEAAGLILTEKTGAFLLDYQRTGREATDITAWYYVPNISKPDDLIRFDTQEAVDLDYEIMQALILQYAREQTDVRANYHKLELVKMRNELPMTEKTIRGHIKELMSKGRLVKLPLHPKYYRVVSLEEAAESLSERKVTAFLERNERMAAYRIGGALKAAA
jgi:biotin operon repressor